MSKKQKTNFLCNNCGYEALRWLGRCPSCQEWNTLQEFSVGNKSRSGSVSVRAASRPVAITEVESAEESRWPTGMAELDRVLGGGIIQGSLILIGGEPGIGKSTMLLQVSAALARSGGKVLYVTGEESSRQISLRAHRVNALDTSVLLLAEHDFFAVETAIREHKPDFVIIDSIQTLFNDQFSSSPGTVSQVRECTAGLMRLAKETGCSVLLVGHVTKDGSLAGPKTLEHMVDCVLYFEGDRHHTFRLVRCVKNRFGATNEIGVFLMTTAGLNPVDNPSELFLSQHSSRQAGSVVTATLEGTRPLLVEIQALVAGSGYATPRRMADGVDHNRTALLLAVLDKRAGLHLQDHDAYINVVGGVQVSEPAVDLAVILAVASAFRERPLPRNMIAVGEVGLTGEVRAVARLDQRLREAAKLGFAQAVVPRVECVVPPNFNVIPADTVSEAIDAAFGGDKDS
ncbi:MAG: DNA repair protein RadA [Firmicutes bacterium]|nr:DNA repair protein RadA [Bacillota bacterium]